MPNLFVKWRPGILHFHRDRVQRVESPSPTSPLPTGQRNGSNWKRIAWTAGVGLVALHLTNPLTWGLSYPGVWFPPAAIGILLAAWIGRGAGFLIAVDAILVAIQAALLGHTLPWGHGWVGWLGVCLDAPLSGAEAVVAWHLYYTIARCPRRPTEPVGACLFLFVIPGLATGAFALMHAMLAPGPAGINFSAWLGALWLSRALAILAIVPVCLVTLTLWLLSHRLAIPETDSDRHHDAPVRLTSGDVVELIGLVGGTALLAGLLTVAARQENGASWQLWMLTLLLIVWASLRQGIRGATIASFSATVAALAPAVLDMRGATWAFPLQGYVFAFCTTGLLVGVSSDWMQLTEFRGRLLVGHVPIVIYSARFHSKKGLVPPTDKIEITYLNPAATSVLKRQRDQLLGSYSKWLQQVHPHDREVLHAAITQLTIHEQSVTVEYRLSPSGDDDVPASEPAPTSVGTHDLPLSSDRPPRLTWVRDTLVPTFDANRQIVGWEGVVLEITEQRLLADDLRRTTKMFHSLVTNLPAGVFFVHAPSGRPILINARARELLGQPADLSARLPQWSEVYRLHRPDGSVFPTEELPVSVALRNGVTHMRDDIVVHRRDGRKIPLITWAAPLDLRGRGAPDAAVWVLEDMTALRKAEAAHRESEARLRTLIETMAEGLIVCDRNGIIVESNPAAAQLLSIAPEDVIGQSITSKFWSYRRESGAILPTEEHPVFRSLQTGQPTQDEVIGVVVSRTEPAPILAAATNGSAHHRLEETPWKEDLFPLENGQVQDGVRWLLVSTRPLMRGNDSRTLRIVTTLTDITALRQAANVVRASEARYRGLIESMPLMLLQSDHNGRITYINPALRELTDYDLEDLHEPEGWRILVVPEDQGRWQNAQTEALDQGRESRLELHLKTRDGGERTCLMLVQPRRSQDQIVGLNTLILDMTMQRQLERKLQRSQRMELAGRLASGLAHDFNNQLTVILNLVSLVQSQLGSEHPVQPDLESITEAGEQAARLAGQLLAFSKQRQLNTKRLDLGDATGRILTLLRATLPKAIQLDFSCGEAGLDVDADETQIQQLLMNLMLNARDAMPTGGRLTVRLDAEAPPEIGDAESGEWVHLSIDDTGHGMTEQTRLHIFDPFFTTKANGTGLGLAVVQQIVESSNGRLTVTSECDKGTCFDVWLPRAEACKMA